MMTLFVDPAERAKAMGISASSRQAGAHSGCCSVASSRTRSTGTDLPRQRAGRSTRDRPHRRGDLRGTCRDSRRAARPGRSDDRDGFAHDGGVRDRQRERGRLLTARTLDSQRPLFCSRSSSPSRRVPSPLVPLRLLRRRNVAVSNVVGVFWAAAMFAWFFPHGALPAARARLQPAAGRACISPGEPRHGCDVDRPVRQARPALRHSATARRGTDLRFLGLVLLASRASLTATSSPTSSRA